MSSMDDMMSMSFDQLSSTVNPGMGVAATSGPGGSLALGFGGGPALLTAAPTIPNHPHELDVFLSGPGAEAACRGARAEELSPLPPDRALKACKGKKDFILFEDMDDAVRDGQRVVLVTLKGDGRALRGVQAYLAESLARWLGEQKLDGAGKPYGETKDQDPTLRKFFTRAQNTAIQNWGRS